ncbi:hypothetical protein BDE02_01G205200 [Populus trichocarpa]|nr:hypothetical protein BDE02_01G205200 [Populus trichocarpa]
MSSPTDPLKLVHSDELVSVGVEISADGFIPVVDVEGLQGPRRPQIVKQIGHACQHYGAFIVKNHGIPETVFNNFLGGATMDFFRWPEREKLKFYTPKPGKFDNTEPRKPIEYFRAYTTGENVSLVRELAYVSCLIGDYANQWPSIPPSFRERVTDFSTSAKRVEFALGEAICESLGLERDYIKKKLLSNHEQKVAMNFYPARKQEDSELTCVLRDHTDPTIITILSEQNVHGLQILHDGEWMNVNLSPNHLIVLTGDLLQVLSNRRYKSLPHRVIVTCEKDRLSIATYCNPSDDSTIEPAKELIDNDHPAIYKNFTYREFKDNVELAVDDARLNVFKITAAA